MKKMMLLISLMSIQTLGTTEKQQPDFSDVNLVSPVNYMAPALTGKKTLDHKIEVIVKVAVLQNSDNYRMFDPQLKELIESTFGLKNFNALILTFDEKDCQQNIKNLMIFECNTIYQTMYSAVKFQSAIIGWSDLVPRQVSPKFTYDRSVQISTISVTTIDVRNFKETSLTANLSINSLGLNLRKSRLTQNKFQSIKDVL